MDNFYTVEYKRHNKVSGAWAYKSELGTTNIDEAYKKAYALLGEFVGGDTFDMVNVIMSDRNGLVLVNEKWEARPIEPQTAE